MTFIIASWLFERLFKKLPSKILNCLFSSFFLFKGHHGVILNPDGLSSNLTHYVANTAVPADDGSGGIVSVIPEPQPPATYYFALMLGAWIVTPDWVKQSLDCGSFVDETEFEVLLLHIVIHSVEIKFSG